MKKYTFLAFSSLLLFIACSDPTNGTWDIPNDEVFDGGPGKDGIPAIDNPELVSVTDAASFMQDDDLVIGYVADGEAHAYAHFILDWHEIINDDIGNESVAITYCPLTGTGVGWDRIINGEKTTFGVSGLLYNTNLIPYDRKTDSNWSQIGLDCVNGELRGQKVKTHQLLETTWSTWKAMFPNSQITSLNTGFNRSYGTYPYGSYRTNNELFFFPVNPNDNRLDAKERVLGIIQNENAKVYRFNTFGESGTGLVQDDFGGTSLVVVGDQNRNFIMAFERIASDGTILEFTPISDSDNVVMEDQEGNKWNIFGRAIEGARTGEYLPRTNSFMGYWFSFPAFYTTTIYQ